MRKNMLNELVNSISPIKKQLKMKGNSGQKTHYCNDKNGYYILKVPENIIKSTLTVYIHGGAMRISQASEFEHIGDFHNELGYINLNLCYRKVPDYIYPTQINDVFSGLQHALNYLKKLGIEIDDIVICGSSAGAYLGSMLCFNHELQKKYKLDNYNFTGFCSLSGWLNLDTNSDNFIYNKIINDYLPDLTIKNANPIYYVENSHNTKMLLFHSLLDPLVEFKFVKEYYDKYVGPKELITIEDKMHIALCISPFYYNCPEKETYVKWLEQFK